MHYLIANFTYSQKNHLVLVLDYRIMFNSGFNCEKVNTSRLAYLADPVRDFSLTGLRYAEMAELNALADAIIKGNLWEGVGYDFVIGNPSYELSLSHCDSSGRRPCRSPDCLSCIVPIFYLHQAVLDLKKSKLLSDEPVTRIVLARAYRRAGRGEDAIYHHLKSHVTG